MLTFAVNRTAAVILAAVLGTASGNPEEITVLDETLKRYEMTSADSLKETLIGEYAMTNSLLMREEDIMDSVMELEGFDATVKTEQTVTVRIKIAENGALPMTDTIVEKTQIMFTGTQAPEIILKENEIKILKGQDFDPQDYIETLSDDSGIAPGLVIDNPVSTDETGKYTVTYTAMDTEGNMSEETLAVSVYKPQPKKAEASQATITRSAYLKQGAYNPYSGGWSNCTWSAWTLARQYTGLSLPNWGSAAAWLYGAASDDYITSSYPSPYCIAVYSGHVALVTAVSGDSVYIKEGGYLGGYNERWVSVYGTGTQGCLGYIWLHG